MGGQRSLKKKVSTSDTSLDSSSAQPPLLRAMAPKEKVTAEQKAYLLALIDDYLEVRKQADFTKFWARLFLDWFKLWPVEVDTSIKDEEERRAACGIAIKEQESVSCQREHSY